MWTTGVLGLAVACGVAGWLMFPAAATAADTGSITREVWSGVSGAAVADIPLTTAPSSVGTIGAFEAPQDAGDNYGQRVRGYLAPPATGSYTFWVAGDDNVQLWLSTDASPSSKRLVAYHSGWTNVREWNKYPADHPERRAAADRPHPLRQHLGDRRPGPAGPGPRPMLARMGAV